MESILQTLQAEFYAALSLKEKRTPRTGVVGWL